MRYSRLVWWLLLPVLAIRLHGQTANLVEVETNGPRDKRINMVFLSDGYTTAELPQFAVAVQNAVNYLFSREPWQQYRSYCNVYRIEIASNESGTDNGAAGGNRNTYLNSGFSTPSVAQLLTLDSTGQSRVFSLLNQHVPEYDVPIVLVNDPKYGGSGGAIAVSSVNSSGIQIVEHELGHSFAGLADEYDIYYAIYTPAESRNATQETNRSLIRWNVWIDAGTPVPTPETLAYNSAVGLFEGASYRTNGWYRPHYNSLMQSLGRPVGQVNREQFVLNYYSRVSPVDGFTPAQTNLTVTTVTNLDFTVIRKQPNDGSMLQVTWELNGNLLNNQTNPTLAIASTMIGNGSHIIRATVKDLTPFVRNDPTGLLNDSVAWLVALTNQNALPPSITVQPVGNSIYVGQSVTFSVSATDSSPFTYQWRKNGVNISVATAASYTISNAQTTHAGGYSVVVSNPFGSATSGTATLTVNVPVAPTISSQPQTQTVTIGQTATFSVTASGSPTPSYQWRKNGADISGATGSAYAISNTQLSHAGSYDVVVSNLGGSVTSSGATLNVSGPPVITTQPVNQTAIAGTTLTLSVTASGPPPLAYQWRRDGTNLSGATNPSLVRGAAQPSDSGSYSVLVSNPYGSVTSAPPALLSVYYPTPGSVVAWGYNDSGQTTVPAGLSGVTAVVAGARHTVALKGDGTVQAWGDNSYGQSTVPVSAQSGVKSVSGEGGNHNLALKAGGTVVAWGSNTYGQTNVPPAIQGSVAAIAAAGDHCVGLLIGGTVVAWGWNDYGQTSVPAGLTGVKAVAAGLYHSVALKTNGAVIAWGATGVLGDNNFGQTNVPPAALSGVVAIAAGGWHTVALKNDGTVVEWGQVFAGGTNMVPVSVPVGLSGVQAIAAGWNHTVALRRDGTVVAWGWNGAGQTTVPAGLRSVTAIAAGWNHTAAVVGLVIDSAFAGNNLTLLWPDPGAGYRLESALSLAPPVQWSTETVSLQTNGGNISVLLAAPAPRKFYRLTRP